MPAKWTDLEVVKKLDTLYDALDSHPRTRDNVSAEERKEARAVVIAALSSLRRLVRNEKGQVDEKTVKVMVDYIIHSKDPNGLIEKLKIHTSLAQDTDYGRRLVDLTGKCGNGLEYFENLEWEGMTVENAVRDVLFCISNRADAAKSQLGSGGGGGYKKSAGKAGPKGRRMSPASGVGSTQQVKSMGITTRFDPSTGMCPPAKFFSDGSHDDATMSFGTSTVPLQTLVSIEFGGQSTECQDVGKALALSTMALDH